MTNRELNSQIRRRIKSGTSKSALYAELKEGVEDEILRKALAAQPSYELRNYFKVYFGIISFVLGMFIFVEFLAMYEFLVDFRIQHLLSFSISIYLAVKIWSFSGPFFLSGVIWLSYAFVQGYYALYASTSDPDFEMLRIITVVYSVFLFLGVVFMWMLYRNIFSYYRWFDPKKDSENRSRFE